MFWEPQLPQAGNMSTCADFQAQVTSIMEILCRTAAQEIGKLVDDRCALLRVAARRCRNENEALRRKVRKMERERRAAEESRSCLLGNAHEKEVSSGLWNEVQAADVDEINTPKDSDALGEEASPLLGAAAPVEIITSPLLQSKDLGEESLESLFIKEEHLEEDSEKSDPQGGLKTIKGLAAKTGAVSPEKSSLLPGPAAPFEHETCKEEYSIQVMPAADQEHILGQDWSRCSDVGPRGLKLVTKDEQKDDIIVRRCSLPGFKPNMGKKSSRGFENMKDNTTDKSSSCSLCTETDCESEADKPDEYLAAGQYSHAFIGDQHSARRAGSGTMLSEKYFEVKSYSDMLNSDAMNDTDRLSTETEPSRMREDPTMQPSQQHSPLQGQMTVTDSAAETNSRPADASVLCGKRSNFAKRVEALRKFSIKEKQFLCTQCGKHFTRCSHLIIHQRCHTGEKPYCCLQCGKHFSLRCNLITHQRIHTGEKPFSCARCGMCFAQKSSLKTHERIHTGEKPFHCSQCGKRFAQSSSLRTHQRIHSRN